MVSSLTISTCGSRSKAGWYQNTDHQRSVTDPRKDCKARRAEHLNTASAQSLITDSKTVIPYSKPWFTSARSHEARAVASGDFATSAACGPPGSSSRSPRHLAKGQFPLIPIRWCSSSLPDLKPRSTPAGPREESRIYVRNEREGTRFEGDVIIPRKMRVSSLGCNIWLESTSCFGPNGWYRPV